MPTERPPPSANSDVPATPASGSSDASAASGAAPSRVLAEVYCPHCCERVASQICFFYGAPGSFQLGDSVRGQGASRVVADAFVEGPCPACAWVGAWPVEVWLERDRLVSVSPPSRRFNWVQFGNFIEDPPHSR